MARLTSLFWASLHFVQRTTVQVPSRCIHSIGKTEVSAVRIHVCQLPSHLTGQQASLQTQHRSLPLICGAYELCTDATSGHSWLSFSLLSGRRAFVDLKWHELTSYLGWGLCTWSSLTQIPSEITPFFVSRMYRKFVIYRKWPSSLPHTSLRALTQRNGEQLSPRQNIKIQTVTTSTSPDRRNELRIGAWVERRWTFYALPWRKKIMFFWSWHLSISRWIHTA